MRVKQIWAHVPLPQNIKLFWDRITFSKLTTFYFVFSILHCLVQVGFQTRAYMINSEAADFLYGILRQGGAESAIDFISLEPDFTLRMCSTVPDQPDPILAGQCRVVWDGQPRSNWIGSEPAQKPPASLTSFASADPTVTAGVQNNIQVSQSSPIPIPSTTSTITVFTLPTPAPLARPTIQNDEDDDDVDFVFERRDNFNVSSVRLSNGQTVLNVTRGGSEVAAVLDNECLWALNYPVSVLHNTKREDVVFIIFQVWVLSMSIVALLNESIPHVVASLMTHFLATGWSVYQIFHTMEFQSNFKRVISQGACNGTTLLSDYWKQRAIAEIPAASLNGLALGVSCFLTYRLFKLFGWQTFKRIGASLTINRLYKVVLTLSITIQLAAFFIFVTASLWLDQLLNTNLGRQATFLGLYKADSIAIIVLVLPWTALGWISVRREHRIGMSLFLGISCIYLSGWGAMFFSWTFRREFMTWRFFSVMASLSVALTFVALVLGVVSFFNFDKGLPRYLAAQEELTGEEFPRVQPGVADPEKVEFPTSGPVPTFSAAFGAGDEVPVPTKMFPQTQVGPRFFRSAEPFETSSAERTTLGDSTRPPTYATQAQSLHRTNSTTSESSIGSYYSYSGKSESTGKKDRWVIE